MQAIQSERRTDMTNELLKGVKMGTRDGGSPSAVVDIETLQTNKSRDAGRAEQDPERGPRVKLPSRSFTRIEDELKQKMMEIRS